MSFFYGFCAGVVAMILAIIVVEVLRWWDGEGDDEWF